MAIGAIASLGITTIGLTIWGVKKHLDNKKDPSEKDNKDDNKKNNENIEVSNEDNAENLNEDIPKKDEKINNNGTLNKKNNAKTHDQEFKFRDQNIKEFRERGGVSEKDLDALIKIIDRKVSYNIYKIYTQDVQRYRYLGDFVAYDEEACDKSGKKTYLYDKKKDG